MATLIQILYVNFNTMCDHKFNTILDKYNAQYHSHYTTNWGSLSAFIEDDQFYSNEKHALGIVKASIASLANRTIQQLQTHTLTTIASPTSKFNYCCRNQAHPRAIRTASISSKPRTVQDSIVDRSM